MNKLLLTFLLICPTLLHSQTDRRIDSKITDITVFLNRAQVTRVVNSKCEPGKTNFVVQGLTSQLDPGSIQVRGKGKFTILGLAHQQNFINEFNLPPRARALRDSLQLLQDQIQQVQSKKEIVNKEEQLILGNQKIGGANQNLTVTELKSMADFFRNRLAEISDLRMKYDKQLVELNERLTRVQKQFREHQELLARNTSEMVITVTAETATPVELEISYVVNNAGWTPVYDLRGTDTKRPVQLSYKANVFQRTGEEWKNVRLKLSTGNPSLGGAKPVLHPWYLDFTKPMVVRTPKYRYENKAEAAPSMAETAYGNASEDAATVADFTDVVQTTLNTEFAISLPYTIMSAGKPTMVDIGMYSLNAEYVFFTSPKLERDAFLMARITGWEEYNLLPGEANVFMEGTFVAKTFIDPNEIRDTLSISLGRDKRIVVQREKVKDFTSKKFIGSNQREAYAFETTIRNTRDEPVRLFVEDQIPVSKNNQIEVSLLDGGNARHNSVSGKLEWEITLQPQEQRKLVYKYEVKYPRDKTVFGLN